MYLYSKEESSTALSFFKTFFFGTYSMQGDPRNPITCQTKCHCKWQVSPNILHFPDDLVSKYKGLWSGRQHKMVYPEVIRLNNDYQYHFND